ncbi:MAG: hypothetical protein JXR31_06565 [Prolixibacteraceae bacterium]|nr:hypothetical protein [Prolixibacteraceae bacterium]MBN2773893.1 hypothetical protein [Prolixibacteraceae bacterium]
MKTKNNVQKAFLRSVALLVSLVLLSLTVTAQGYWKQLLINNSFNHLASALVENPSNHQPENDNGLPVTFSDYFYSEVEESLELEPWMTSVDMGLNPFSQEVSDQEIQLEKWMLDTNSLNSDDINDDSLKLETWMTKTVI